MVDEGGVVAVEVVVVGVVEVGMEVGLEVVELGSTRMVDENSVEACLDWIAKFPFYLMSGFVVNGVVLFLFVLLSNVLIKPIKHVPHPAPHYRQHWQSQHRRRGKVYISQKVDEIDNSMLFISSARSSMQLESNPLMEFYLLEYCSFEFLISSVPVKQSQAHTMNASQVERARTSPWLLQNAVVNY